MGSMEGVECQDCGHRFQVASGGGFMFHLLNCTQCGEQKSLPFDELGEVHVQYLKGLNVPYSMATAEANKAAREAYSGEAITEEVYRQKVEEIAGRCACGGSFSFSAGPRCPQCRSDRLEDTGVPGVLYD